MKRIFSYARKHRSFKAKNGKTKSLRTLIDSKKYADISCGFKLSDNNIGYENGVNSTTPETLIKIARFYDVSVDYLLELTDEKRHYKRCG